MTTPNQSVSIARSTSGPATDAAGAAAIFAVIGCAADGSLVAPTLVRNDRDPTTVYEGGPLVEVSEIVSSYSRQATIAMRAATDVAGSCGTINLDDFSGTIEIDTDDAVVPYVDAELYIVFDQGGTLGTAADDIQYRVSTAGRYGPFGPRTALGAGASILVESINVRVLLSVSSSGYVTRVNALRTAMLAHFTTTAGGVHLASDTSSDDGIASAATDLATSLTLAGTLITAAIAHATNNTAHTTDDANSFADMPSAPTNEHTLVTFLDAFTVMWNTHVHRTTGSTGNVIHGAADDAHLVTAVPLASIEDGNIIQIPISGPTWDATGLAAAFAALADYTGSFFGGVLIPGSFDPSLHWATLIAGLNLLRDNQVPVIAIIEARGPTPAVDETPGETVAEYRMNLTAEWAAYTDERVHVVAGRGRYDPATLARCGSQYYRSHLAPLGARLAALDYGESPGATKDTDRDPARPSKFGGPLDGFRIYDDANILIGWDERKNPGLADGGFGVTTSFPHVSNRLAAYAYRPRDKAPAGNRAPHIAHQRVVNVVEFMIYEVFTEEIEAKLLFEPGRFTLRNDVADGLDIEANNRILAVTGDPALTNAARLSRLLVRVDRNLVIDPGDPVIAVYVEVDTAFYTSAFTVNLQVNKGA